MKRRRLLELSIAFFISLVVTIGCIPSQTPRSSTIDTPNTTPTQKSEPVVLGYSTRHGWLPWQLANDQDFFATNNVTVKLKPFDAYRDSIKALTAGQLDANSQTLGDTIQAISTGAELVIVLTNDYSTGNDKIIAADGINSLEALRGKKVAAEANTAAHLLLLLGLQEAGLTQDDIQFQSLATKAAADAFVAGEVDAVSVFAPFTTRALDRPGSQELFNSADVPGMISDHLVVSRKMIEERPNEVQRLVNTWFATIDTINQNRSQALSTLANHAGVSVEAYKTYTQGTSFFNLDDNFKAMKPRNDMKSLPHAARAISRFMVNAKLISEEPSLNGLFDDRFLKVYEESTPS